MHCLSLWPLLQQHRGRHFLFTHRGAAWHLHRRDWHTEFEVKSAQQGNCISGSVYATLIFHWPSRGINGTSKMAWCLIWCDCSNWANLRNVDFVCECGCICVCERQKKDRERRRFWRCFWSVWGFGAVCLLFSKDPQGTGFVKKSLSFQSPWRSAPVCRLENGPIMTFYQARLQLWRQHADENRRPQKHALEICEACQ